MGELPQHVAARAPASRTRLGDVSNRQLVLRFEEEGDYIARALLIARGVLDDTQSATLNDYAHYLAARHLGAKRIHKPRSSLNGYRSGRHLAGCADNAAVLRLLA